MAELYMQYGVAVVSGVVFLVGLLWSKVLWDRLKDTKAGRVLARTGQEMKAVLLSVNQTYVKALREANADGKLTEAEKKEAMARAMKELKSNLGVKGLRRLARILGLPSADFWLETQAEGMLGELKASGLIPGSKDHKDTKPVEPSADPKE